MMMMKVMSCLLVVAVTMCTSVVVVRMLDVRIDVAALYGFYWHEAFVLCAISTTF